MTRVLTIILCTLAMSAQGATHYVRNAATGTGDGSDWVNAYIGLSVFTPVRGDTYYIADGSYSGKIFTTPVSGTTYIYFKRATPASHGTSTGWNDSYASGHVVFSGSPVFDLRTSYLDFDGETGSGTSGYGILLNVSDGAPNSGGFQVYNGSTADHIRINHIEIRGTGPQTAAQSTRGFYIHGNSVNDWQVSNCYVHENLEWVHTLNLNNSTFDHCYFQNCGSSTMQHGNGFSLTGDSITFSYCTVENMLGTSNTTYFEPQGTPTSNLNIYGCVIRATSPNERTTQWSFISTASISTVTGHAYNNTIYALHGIDPGIQAAGPGFIAENNVWQNCFNNPTFAGTVTADHNILNTPFAVNFKDPVNGDFHLVSPTQNGVTLPSPFDTDPDGIPRAPGNWSYGAFQIVGPGSPGTVSFSQAAGAISETGASLIVTVNRSGGSSGAVSITATTADGTALSGHDYSSTSFALNWADGMIGARSFSIPIINSGDTASTNRVFTISLGSAGGGVSIGSLSTQTVTIVMNRPAGTIQWSPQDYSTMEATASVALTATRVGGSVGILSGTYATANGTALSGHDYTAASGTITFADSDTANKTITVNLINSGDTSASSRAFTVGLAGTGIGSPATANVTIAMNPVLPAGNIQWTASSFSTTEGASSVVLTAQRFGGVSGAISADYATADGSALSGRDYVQKVGTITWLTGDSANKSITVFQDNSGDMSNTPRTFTVTLSNPTGGAGLGLATTTVSIAMNPIVPPPPVVAFGTVGFTPTIYMTKETNGSVVLSVTRTGGTNAAVQIQYATANATAAAGLDYVTKNGTLSWGANENSTKTFDVQILNSGSFGPPRSFMAILGAPTQGLSISPSQAAVSISLSIPIGLQSSVTIGGHVQSISGNVTIGSK